MVALRGRGGKASFDEAFGLRVRQRAKLLRTWFCLTCRANAASVKKPFR